MFGTLAEFLKNIFIFVGMVMPKSSFPRQLSQQEERELVERLKSGDTEARNLLIEHNLRLVAHIAKKYAAKGRSMDDLISVGTIGLVKAIGTFNAEKGRSIAGYAARCIENEILMSLRAEKKHGNEVSLEDPIGVDRDGNEITLSDVLSSESDSVMDAVIANAAGRSVHKAISEVLTPRERCVIEMRYGLIDGLAMPQREVGKRLHISRSYVSRIEKRALEKLNDKLTGSIYEG